MHDTAATSSSIADIKAQLAGGPALSASTINLIVWIDERSVREKYLSRARQIAEKHPSRTLVFDVGEERRGQALITPSVRGDGDESITVLGSVIDIGIGPDEVGRICETLLALRVPDLPSVLWWVGDTIADQPAFDAILGCGVETVVLDSSGVVADHGSVRDLTDFGRRHPEVQLHDLAWLRLRPWQDMIAQFFDDPNLVAELFEVRALRIESGSDAEALYLAAWLASRLGWTASGPNRFRDRNGREIAYEGRRIGEARRVREVTLETEHASYHGRVHADDEKTVEVWSDGPNAREPRVVALPALETTALVERAILATEIDPLYASVLATVKTILG